MLTQEQKDLLTSRELQIVQQVATGACNATIAAGLFLNEKTVKFHLTNVYKKLSLKSRAQLIVKMLGA